MQHKWIVLLAAMLFQVAATDDTQPDSHFLEPKNSVLSKASSIGIINDNCKSNDGELFLFWSYDDYEIEYECEEKIELERILGARPVSSFQLLARNNNANFALKKVIELFNLSFGVMDDDNGKYWTLDEIIYHSKSILNPSIYNLLLK